MTQLHHGMPPVPDADAVILHNLGADIPVARCHRRKAPVHVRLCQQGGSFLDALAPVCDKTPQLAEQLVLIRLLRLRLAELLLGLLDERFILRDLLLGVGDLLADEVDLLIEQRLALERVGLVLFERAELLVHLAFFA